MHTFLPSPYLDPAMDRNPSSGRPRGLGRPILAAAAYAALVLLLSACSIVEETPPGPPQPTAEPRAESPVGARGDGPSAAGLAGPTDAYLRSAMEESSEVVRTVERFHEALSSGDTAAVLSLLLPGARIVEGGRVETREQYASHHLGADVEFLGGMTTEDTHIQAWVEDDVAWAVATTDLSGRAGERDLELASTELTVLVRHPEEGWRIAAVHWSSRTRDRE